MKSPRKQQPAQTLTLIALALIFLFPSLARAADAPSLVTMVVEVYQTKRTTADPFLRAVPVDVNQLLLSQQKSSQGFNSLSKLTRFSALTTRNGQRGVAKGSDTMFEAEPLVDRDGKKVTLKASLKFGAKELATTADANMGGAVFLGTFDGATPDSVQLAFIRILKQQSRSLSLP